MVMKQHILIVDDEVDILELIRFSMQQDGFQTYTAKDAKEAWSILQDEHIDLAVLDIGLPGVSGIELCQQMKTDNRLREIPIIFATARTQEADLLLGYQAGASDYVRKPFSPKELQARVHALLKRNANLEKIYRVGNLEIFTERHLLRIDQQPINITHREFGVLLELIEAQGRTTSRPQLLERVWGMDAHSGLRSVDIVITRLREKIKPYHTCIRTVAGFGYQWAPDLVSAQN